MKDYIIKFESFVGKLLEFQGYKVLKRDGLEINKIPDYLCHAPNGDLVIVEAKFYQSPNVPLAFFNQLFYQTRSILHKFGAIRAIIVTNASLGNIDGEKIKGSNLELWDYETIFMFLKDRLDLLSEFHNIIQEGRMFSSKVSEEDEEYYKIFRTKKLSEILLGSNPQVVPLSPGKSICEKLNKLPMGKEGAKEFEKLCFDALKYIFSEDLTSWKDQLGSSGGLHRFDLIARISSQNDFWRTLVMLHRTRYVVFEFKNYTDPIGQNQIYGTEKYLYPHAMRSVAIIIARNGASKNALSAANGAIRESGKIIIVLSLVEICKMLDARDQGNDPSDILAEILDDILMHIER